MFLRGRLFLFAPLNQPLLIYGLEMSELICSLQPVIFCQIVSLVFAVVRTVYIDRTRNKPGGTVV